MVHASLHLSGLSAFPHTPTSIFSPSPELPVLICSLTSVSGMKMAQDARWWHWGDISCQSVHVTPVFLGSLQRSSF